MSAVSVFLLGSRSLSLAGVRLCERVGRSLAASGWSASVGCAVGADLGFVSGWLAVPGAAPRLSVFAVGGPSGVGFPASGSAWRVRLAAGAGSPVSWWAGGGPSVPLRVRLAARSSAALAGCRFAFGVVSSPSSRGSFRSLRLAAAAGAVCFVVPVGFAPSLLPALGRGAWVRSSFRGVRCFRWSPEVSRGR